MVHLFQRCQEDRRYETDERKRLVESVKDCLIISISLAILLHDYIVFYLKNKLNANLSYLFKQLNQRYS